MTDHPKSYENLARLCTLDIGRIVEPEDVRGFVITGESWLVRRGFSPAEVAEIRATVFKELLTP